MVVMNNGNTNVNLALNEQAAHHLGLECQKVIGGHDNAGYSHQRALSCTLKLICKDTEPALIVDSDVFCVAHFSFTNRFLSITRFVGLAQGEVPFSYLWPGWLYINRPIIKKLEDLHLKGVLWKRSNTDEYIIPDESFNFDDYPNLREDYISSDSGGGLALFEKDWRRVSGVPVEYLRQAEPYTMRMMPEKLRPLYRDEFNFWMLDGSWIHMGRGSNWDNMSSEEVNTKTHIMREWINHHARPA